MQTIWKYAIPITDRPVIDLPVGARIVHVTSQHSSELTVWAEIDRNAPIVPRPFAVVGTGSELPNAVRQHVGTAIDDTLGAVWHLYELFSKEEER